MNATKSRLIFHLIAIVTVIIWGTTFTSHILIQMLLTLFQRYILFLFVLLYLYEGSTARSFLPIVLRMSFYYF